VLSCAFLCIVLQVSVSWLAPELPSDTSPDIVLKGVPMYEGQILQQNVIAIGPTARETLKDMVSSIIELNREQGVKIHCRGPGGRGSAGCLPNTRLRCSHNGSGAQKLANVKPGEVLTDKLVEKAKQTKQRSTDWLRVRAGRVSGTTAHALHTKVEFVRRSLSSIMEKANIVADLDTDVAYIAKTYASNGKYERADLAHL
jgi:hypothetical protein